jgi:hypothetical protein
MTAPGLKSKSVRTIAIISLPAVPEREPAREG